MISECVVCRGTFMLKGRRKYCSNACKQRAYRKVGVKLGWRKRPNYEGSGKSDCVPSSIAFASGKPFAAIKEWLVDVTRKVGDRFSDKGFTYRTYSVVLTALGFSKMDGWKGELLSTMKHFRDGLYIVSTRKHMFAILDGEIFDSWNSQKKYLKRLRCAWSAPVGFAIQCRKRLASSS